jgi:hypothetical protein
MCAMTDEDEMRDRDWGLYTCHRLGWDQDLVSPARRCHQLPDRIG